MGEVTLVGTIEGEGVQLARATLELDGDGHARDRGDRFVLRVADDDRVTAHAATLRAVLPSSTRSETWGALATDPRAELFADIAPGDHVEAKLGGWALRAGHRVAVRGEVTAHQLEGGGPRDGATERPSAIAARQVAIIEADDSDGRRAIELLDRADAQEAERARQAEKREQAARAAQIAEEAKVPRPLQRMMLGLAVLGVALAVFGLVTWRGVAEATAGTHASWASVFSIAAFVVALHVVALILICFIARPPFEVVGSGEPAKKGPSWDIGLAAGFFLALGTAITLSMMISIAFSGLGVLVVPLGLFAIACFVFLWWARARQRCALRLARLILSTPAVTPAAGTWGRFAGKVVSSPTAGPVLEHLVTWTRHSYTNQSTHGPNAGATRRWFEATASTNEQPFFTIDAGGTPIIIHTSDLQWGAPFEYRPSSVVATRAACEPGDEVLLLARPKLEGDTLVARATGPESLVLFAARTNARATLQRLALSWWSPAIGLALLIAGSVAWSVWALARG